MNIERLEKKIRKARAAYYNGDPVMSDIEFDDLMNILRSESPDSRVLKEVGAKPAGSVGLHSIPMGSLKEAKTMEEMQAWMSDINGGFLVMAKVDGLSLSLDYERGKLVQALTRGNGKVGEDVTANVLMMQNVSKELTGFTGTLRGEAYLPVKIFKEKYAEDYANPRNTAVGIVRRHSGEGAEDVALLYFYVEEHRRNGGDYVATFDTQSRMLLYIRNYLRLKTVDAFQTKDIATFRKAWADVEATRYKKDYEMDGVVVYVENICERRVGNPFLPDHAFVYKFEPETAKTTVTMIEHVAGRSGRVGDAVCYPGCRGIVTGGAIGKADTRHGGAVATGTRSGLLPGNERAYPPSGGRRNLPWLRYPPAAAIRLTGQGLRARLGPA